jgi:cytochrome c biogenesis protein CcmG/thiol:disulfide interchange protein DsbE
MSLPCLGDGVPAMSVTAVHGRPEVINFWASWCASCAAELDLLARAHAAAADRVLILGVDSKDDQGAATDAIAAAGATYPEVLDPPGAFALKLGVVGLPATIFIDGSGTIVERVPGPLTPELLAAALSRIGVTGLSIVDS